MKTAMIILFLLGLLITPSLAGVSRDIALKKLPLSASPWRVIVVGRQSEAERLAAVDLQRYLAQGTGVVPKVIQPAVWKAHPLPAVVIGTPDTNGLLAGLTLDPYHLGDQGYYLSNRKIDGVSTVLAAALSSRGAVNAVYGLLREIGYGFYLGSEVIPGSLPRALPASPVIRRPAFSVRGVLPWYNFFNSPTAWDPVDHRAFVDQLMRMGANFIGFHTYDSEPFAAYEENGKMRWGARLLNTRSPSWGTHPMPSGDFAFGTDKLFAGDYFGAASTFRPDDPDAAVRLEQDLMRDALDYARRRGLQTCLGFEITGDPTDPANREVFLRRIRRLLDQYPSLDFLWIWQPEAQGVQGFMGRYDQGIRRDSDKPGNALELYGIARRPVFRRVVERTAGERPFFQDNEAGKAARAREGARLEQYARLACRALSHRQNTPKLVISGWGGDERLLSAEYYEGLDKLLPQDVVFTSLDHIVPRPRVDRIYRDLPPRRQRWPIPWLEADGDQWHPQPNVSVLESLMRDARRGGSQGILAIHWRTRDVEENFAYLMEYAWQPGLTAAQFFARYAKRCYSPAIAGEMAAIHRDLDRLGYRWVGGAGQSECAPFDWGPGTEEKVQVLKGLQSRVDRLIPKAGKSARRLRWLRNVMDWTLKYRSAEIAAVRARELLGRNRAEEALKLLRGDELSDALRTYAGRISTRGEYGVLATINTKTVVAWRDLRDRALEASGRKDHPLPVADWNPDPEILLPRFVGSAPEKQDLELMPICMGGKPAWVYFRSLGGQRWTIKPMNRVRGWVYRAVIPAEAVRKPGIEVGFSFDPAAKQPMAFGPVAVTVMPRLPVRKAPFAAAKAGRQALLRLSVRTGQTIPIELAWDNAPQAEYFKIYRNGRFMTETAVPFFPDAPAEGSLRYRYAVEAWRDGKVIARLETECVPPDLPVTEKFRCEAIATRGGVVLEWPSLRSLHVASFKIRRSAGSGEGGFEDIGRIRASLTGGNRYGTLLSPGRWTFEIVPVSLTGREGIPARLELGWSPASQFRPVDMSLNRKPEGASITGDIAFGESGATFSEGYIEIPHHPAMDLGGGMTLSFEFKADEIKRMPVLLSHGLWQSDGWFVQILGGRLIIRTPEGDFLGPEIQPGRWYSLLWDFDGIHGRLEVDGQETEPPKPLRPLPSPRTLRVGQYEIIQPDFSFKGSIRKLRIEGVQIGKP